MGPEWPHVQGCYLPRGGIGDVGGLASGAPAAGRGGRPAPVIPGLGSGGADQPQRHRQVPVAQCGGAWG